MTLRVKDWEGSFESAKSKTYNQKSQTYMPNKQGLGYLQLIAMPNGEAMYGAWCAMCHLLSRQPLVRQGYLTDTGRPDGIPWTAEDIALLSRLSLPTVSAMIDACKTAKIGWILDIPEAKDTTRIPQGHRGSLSVSPPLPLPLPDPVPETLTLTQTLTDPEPEPSNGKTADGTDGNGTAKDSHVNPSSVSASEQQRLDRVKAETLDVLARSVLPNAPRNTEARKRQFKVDCKCLEKLYDDARVAGPEKVVSLVAKAKELKGSTVDNRIAALTAWAKKEGGGLAS
jgi:hypothetical protein